LTQELGKNTLDANTADVNQNSEAVIEKLAEAAKTKISTDEFDSTD